MRDIDSEIPQSCQPTKIVGDVDSENLQSCQPTKIVGDVDSENLQSCQSTKIAGDVDSDILWSCQTTKINEDSVRSCHKAHILCKCDAVLCFLMTSYKFKSYGISFHKGWEAS